MKKLIFKSTYVLALALFLGACEKKNNDNATEKPAKVTHIFTAEQQEKITPDEILKEFSEGNERFRTHSHTDRDHSAQILKSAEGQYPKAFVLSCIDSRVPVEDIFDQGIGDIFVGRVAGNFANTDLLGSMEYSCKVSGAKVVLVLGHEHCGAVKGAIDDVKMGNLTFLLNNIKPAIVMSEKFSGEKTTKNKDFVHEVSLNNVKHTMNYIRANSPILKEMEDQGKIKIVGALYSLTNGKVEFLK